MDGQYRQGDSLTGLKFVKLHEDSTAAFVSDEAPFPELGPSFKEYFYIPTIRKSSGLWLAFEEPVAQQIKAFERDHEREIENIRRKILSTFGL
jgi:hypothetical protein